MLGHLQDLVTEPVQPWDCVICSSRAGRDAVEKVLDIREEQILERTGGVSGSMRSRRPRLPVFLYLFHQKVFEPASMSTEEARKQLGIDPTHAVVIWLGRLSLLTKIDPWPTYAVLERVARQLGRSWFSLSVVRMINLPLINLLRNCVGFVHLFDLFV